jgi:hypothetical protein
MATGSNIGDQVEISYQAAQRTDAETVTAGGGE